MKCSELIAAGTRVLKEKGITACRLEAEVLLASAWGRERAHLLIFSDEEVPRDVWERFNAHLCRRGRGVPIAYLVGEKEFMSLMFYVNSDVLIPRPETELLVEKVLEFLANVGGGGMPAEKQFSCFPDSRCQPPKNSTGKRVAAVPVGDEAQTGLVADVGTGCGAVAVSLAYYNTWIHLAATDISPRALRVAKRNARRHGVAERVEFLQGDLLTPLLQERSTGYPGFERADGSGITSQHQQRATAIGMAVAANLPYIPAADLQHLPLDVQYEPRNALAGGGDGLDHYRRLIPQAAAFLAPQGLLACEVGSGQAELLAETLAKEGWTATEISRDYAGLERIVTARRGRYPLSSESLRG